MTSGFTFDIDQAYQSTGTVMIAPVLDSGVYAGYFQATSDLDSIPSLTVSIHTDSASLTSGTSYPCARSGTSDPFDETSVLVKWLDGDSYYTNVMSTQNCTIQITAASQASVSAQLSGTIYDEMDSNFTPHSFTGSFVAATGN